MLHQFFNNVFALLTNGGAHSFAETSVQIFARGTEQLVNKSLLIWPQICQKFLKGFSDDLGNFRMLGEVQN